MTCYMFLKPMSTLTILWLLPRYKKQSAASELYRAISADHQINDGNIYQLGHETITAILTPGHIRGNLSYSRQDRIFTGGALLIGDCGRADFQASFVSSLAQESKFNPRFAGETKAKFIDIVASLNSPDRKQMILQSLLINSTVDSIPKQPDFTPRRRLPPSKGNSPNMRSLTRFKQ